MPDFGNLADKVAFTYVASYISFVCDSVISKPQRTFCTSQIYAIRNGNMINAR